MKKTNKGSCGSLAHILLKRRGKRLIKRISKGQPYTEYIINGRKLDVAIPKEKICIECGTTSKLKLKELLDQGWEVYWLGYSRIIPSQLIKVTYTNLDSLNICRSFKRDDGKKNYVSILSDTINEGLYEVYQDINNGVSLKNLWNEG